MDIKGTTSTYLMELDIIRAAPLAGLEDEAGALRHALRHPN